MTALVATQITDRLAAIAATITTANGYPSNVGATVQIGAKRGMADQAPAIWIIPGRQTVTDLYDSTEISREIEIKAFADLRDHPSLSEHGLVDQVIWDIRKALWAYDATLTDLCDLLLGNDQPGYSEDGGAIVGAGLTLTITYRVSDDDPTTAL
jgi:hypothetical protein